MEHRTTVVEFSIEPANLFAITEDWATKFRFSLYERNANRAIYSRSIRLMKAWLAIENSGEHLRVEAWMSGPGVGPDFTGNAWRGWKTALPSGRFGFGPQFIYRKQFDTLLNSIGGKSKEVTWKNAVQHSDNSQPIFNKSTFINALVILGIIRTLFGILNLLSAISLLVKSAFPSLASTILSDGVFGVISGALLLTSSRALAKGKIIAIWLCSGSILVEGVYPIVTGHPMNYLAVGFGLLFIWQMLKVRNQWKLS